DPGQRGRVIRALPRQQECLLPAHALLPGRAMEIEIALDLPPFFGEQRRQQEARSETVAQPRQDPRPPTWREVARGPPVLRQKSRPDLHVTVLDLGEPGVHAALLRIGLRPRQLP